MSDQGSLPPPLPGDGWRPQEPDWPEPPPDLRRIVPPVEGSQSLRWLPPEEPAPLPEQPPDIARIWAFSGLLLILLGAVVALVVVIHGQNSTSRPSATNFRPPSQQQQQPLSTDNQAIVAKVNSGVVNITTTLAYQNAAAAGTGVVVTSSGEVLTNNHVINGATTIKATVVDNGKTYNAHVIGYDAAEDIAVIQLEGAENLKTVTFGNSSNVNVGDPVIAIGNALGRGGTPSATTGKVTALNQSITATEQDGDSEQLSGLIQIDAMLQPGDSGGPLVDARGNVIGIDTAASGIFSFRRRQAGSTEGFAIPSNQALAIANDIVAGRASTNIHIGATAFLGVRMASDTVSGNAGAVVTGVESGSPADHAGLASGAVITAVDGASMSTTTQLLATLRGHHPGDTIALEWDDDSGGHHSAKVTLAEGPAG